MRARYKKMKAKIYEYEGTPEEIQAMLGNVSSTFTQPKVVVINKATPTPTVKQAEPIAKKGFRQHGAKDWTYEENKVLRANRLLDDAVKLLPNRTRGAIRVQRCKLGIKSPPTYKRTFNFSPKSLDKMRGRMKFINERGNYYMRTYNWSRERAFTQASNDYTNKKAMIAKITPTTPVVQDVKQTSYKVVKWDTTNGKTLTVDVFAKFEDAQNRIIELKNADLSINEEWHYAIVKSEATK